MKRQLLFLLSAFSLFAYGSTASLLTLDVNQSVCPDTLIFDDDGKWVGTYSNDEVTRWLAFNPIGSQPFFYLSHLLWGDGQEDTSLEMSFWDGFTICRSNDSANYGELGNSDGWLNHQWGNMAGGAYMLDQNGHIQTNQSGDTILSDTAAYLVAYWGYMHAQDYNDSEWKRPTQQEQHSLSVRFASRCKPQGVYVCNHPWPYYGNINGDGFARPFAEGDSFMLVVRGLNSKGEDVGTEIRYTLAEYVGGQLSESKQWEYMDLTALGEVSGVYFTMETTDENPLVGPNTAVFFCMNHLQVDTANIAKEERVTGLQVVSQTDSTIIISWDKMPLTTTYTVYLDGQIICRTEENTYTLRGVNDGLQHLFGVSGSQGDVSAIRFTSIDTTPPTAPANLRLVDEQSTSFSVEWDNSYDAGGLRRYNIYMDGELYDYRSSTITNYTFSDDILPETDYTISVSATDRAGNESEPASLRVTTSPATCLQTIGENKSGGVVLINSVASTLPNDGEGVYYDLLGHCLGNSIPTQQGVYIYIQNTSD